MSRRRGVVIAGVMLGGLAAEAAAFDVGDWRLWVPDLLAGWVLLGAAIWVWPHRRARGTAVLLAATGVCWFLGFVPGLLYLHRGPLVHLLVTFPGWRPRRRLDAVAVGVGYLAALYEPLWGEDPTTVLLAAGLVAVAVRGAQVARPVERHDRRVAARAASAFSAVLVVVALGTGPVEDGSTVLPLLLVYEATVALVAVVLAGEARGAAPPAVANLVVELTAPPTVRLQEDLRRVLRDPDLMVGYWSPTAMTYLSAEGQPVLPTAGAADRVVTPVGGSGRPAAVLVHHPLSLMDPQLKRAVTTAVRLSDEHRALHRELAEQRRELARSRQRLLQVSAEERMRLDRQLREGPEALLDELAALLDSLPDSVVSAREVAAHVSRATTHLVLVREDLRDLSAGLMPRELADAGLGPALQALAARSPLPVRVEVDPGPLPPQVAHAAYFICSEAVTNAVKHSRASAVDVRVRRADGRLELVVSDDGIGGIEGVGQNGGSGMSGLVDRAGALGGSVDWVSPEGGGTAVVATLWLEGAERSVEPA